ncbi:MAG TPA: hypothetical protein VEN99_08315 [Acidimicrobiia bacterium]|nr:hypothetical protein [Acidimicrobiia bacterium]
MAATNETITAFQDHILNLLPTVNTAQTLGAVQDQVIESVRKSQDAVVTLVGTWAQAATGLMPETRPLPLADQMPDLVGMVESSFAFLDRLLTVQKDFATALLDAARPVLGGAAKAGSNGETTPRPASKTAT